MRDVTVTGIERTEFVLHTLRTRVQRKVLRKSVNAGATPIVKAARKGAPRRRGHLRQAMFKKVKTYARSGSVFAFVGARDRRMTDGANPSKYLHLVEGGTRPHLIPGPLSFRTKAGVPTVVTNVQHPGSRGQHFLRRAGDSTRQAATAATLAKMTVETDREVAALAK